ncbi:MAG: 2-oxoacid ferredoxin oxidoreductase, partial [Euryarchaeota archaeon]|nr:2-oxoacid ferredoxin oxidoreductase [Euryarchaeota archaeon]
MPEVVKPNPPTWCPGCGDFGVMAALKNSLKALSVPADQTVVVGGIGCSGGIHNFMDSYGFHSLHGRLLPTAVGMKLANPKLTIVAVGGDGDGYAIGMGHFIHTLKKNVDITYIVMNNETYGLTKGQPSPTAPVGFHGNIEGPFDAILTALSIPSAGYIARGFSGAPKEAAQYITEALRYNHERRGFAFVEVLSPCVTYNDTYQLWRQQVEKVEKVSGFDRGDRAKAFATVLDAKSRGKIPVGQIFRAPEDKAAPALDKTLL